MLTPAQTRDMQSVLAAQKTAMQTLRGFDFSLAHELDAKLKADKALLAEFTNDPARIAKREVGMDVPSGFHLHFIDQNNTYQPPEGGALAQLQSSASGKVWSRIEIRSAVGAGCLALCAGCL